MSRRQHMTHRRNLQMEWDEEAAVRDLYSVEPPVKVEFSGMEDDILGGAGEKRQQSHLFQQVYSGWKASLANISTVFRKSDQDTVVGQQEQQVDAGLTDDLVGEMYYLLAPEDSALVAQKRPDKHQNDLEVHRNKRK